MSPSRSLVRVISARAEGVKRFLGPESDEWLPLRSRLQIARNSRSWHNSAEMECFICFVDDHPIENEGDVEFHHIKPFSDDGPSEPANIGPVCKEHHRRIRTLSLSVSRDQLAMARSLSMPTRAGSMNACADRDS
jgi:hypothetical protein